MVSSFTFYDLEIIRAIPGKEPRIDGIDYCDGWNDHANMGVSVVGFCQIWADDRGIDISEPGFLIGDRYGLRAFSELSAQTDGIMAFNGKRFDDRVMKANGFAIETTYDLLDEIRLAAYGSADFRKAPKDFSYKLGYIAEANGLMKTGDGANAAIEWQVGQHAKVINYCMNDVRISAQVFKLGIEGALIDPNTGDRLTLRVPG